MWPASHLNHFLRGLFSANNKTIHSFPAFMFRLQSTSSASLRATYVPHIGAYGWVGETYTYHSCYTAKQNCKRLIIQKTLWVHFVVNTKKETNLLLSHHYHSFHFKYLYSHNITFPWPRRFSWISQFSTCKSWAKQGWELKNIPPPPYTYLYNTLPYIYSKYFYSEWWTCIYFFRHTTSQHHA